MGQWEIIESTSVKTGSSTVEISEKYHVVWLCSSILDFDLSRMYCCNV